MKYSKGFATMASIIIIIALIVGGVVYYVTKFPSSPIENTETNNQSLQQPTLDTTAIQPSSTTSTSNQAALDTETSTTANCNQNQFNSAFLLISPDINNQKTKEFVNFLENLKTRFEQSFKDATYGTSSVKVDDIFVTNIGSENYIDNPSQIDFRSVLKELISKKDDKYDFVSVFTNYDPKSNSDYSFVVRNNIKNIGYENIFDHSDQYGSAGKLLGITFHGDLFSRFKKATTPDEYGNIYLSEVEKDLFGVGVLLHEIGHFWCCYIGENFIGDGDPSKLEILAENMHFYQGLESPSKTQDVLGTVPWLLDENNNTYYRDNSFNTYPYRYHPITLYLMGLLPKDQYSKEFNIFDIGTTLNKDPDAIKKYKTISVNDIIKFSGERACVN